MEISQYSNKILYSYHQKKPRINRLAISNWLHNLAKEEGFRIAGLNYTFCSDEYLLEINRTHLNHNYYTDIITFDISDQLGLVEGDIYISTDRVKENAKALGLSFSNELYRVMAHGLLHLLGYKDKTSAELKTMREKENYYLGQLTI